MGNSHSSHDFDALPKSRNCCFPSLGGSSYNTTTSNPTTTAAPNATATTTYPSSPYSLSSPVRPPTKGQIVILNAESSVDFSFIVSALQQLEPNSRYIHPFQLVTKEATPTTTAAAPGTTSPHAGTASPGTTTTSPHAVQLRLAAEMALDWASKGQLVIMELHDAFSKHLADLALHFKDAPLKSIPITCVLVHHELSDVLAPTDNSRKSVMLRLHFAMQYAVMFKSAAVSVEKETPNFGVVSRENFLLAFDPVRLNLLDVSKKENKHDHAKLHELEFSAELVQAFVSSVLGLDDPSNGRSNPRVRIFPRVDYDLLLDISTSKALSAMHTAREIFNELKKVAVNMRKSALFAMPAAMICSTALSETCNGCLSEMLKSHIAPCAQCKSLDNKAIHDQHPNVIKNSKSLPSCGKCLNKLAVLLRNSDKHKEWEARTICPAAKCDLRDLERELSLYHQIDATFHDDDNVYMHSLWAMRAMQKMMRTNSIFVAGIPKEKYDFLLLAMFLHDIGKTGDHDVIFRGKSNHDKTAGVYWQDAYKFSWLDADRTESLPAHLRRVCPVIDSEGVKLLGFTGAAHMLFGLVPQNKLTIEAFVDKIEAINADFKVKETLEMLVRICILFTVSDVMGANPIKEPLTCDPEHPPVFYPQLMPRVEDEDNWMHWFTCHRKWDHAMASFFSHEGVPSPKILEIREKVITEARKRDLK